MGMLLLFAGLGRFRSKMQNFCGEYRNGTCRKPCQIYLTKSDHGGSFSKGHVVGLKLNYLRCPTNSQYKHKGNYLDIYSENAERVSNLLKLYFTERMSFNSRLHFAYRELPNKRNEDHSL